MSKERSVRRGNTSGLIGLWNQRVVDQEVEREAGGASGGSGGGGGNNVLKIRQDAARRISVRTPPPSTSAGTSCGGFLGDGLHSPGRFRKTSEIVRPTFEAAAQSSGFVASILKEPARSRSPFKGDSSTPPPPMSPTPKKSVVMAPPPPALTISPIGRRAGELLED